MLECHLDQLGAAFVAFETTFMSDKSEEQRSQIVASLRAKTVQTLKAVLDFTESSALRHEQLIAVAYLKCEDEEVDSIPYKVRRNFRHDHVGFET